MSAPWWKVPHAPAQITRANGVPTPLLLPANKADVLREMEALIPAYTFDWTSRSAVDPGTAFTKLYAEITAPIRSRLNRLPEKMMVEYLRTAGIQPGPAQPGTAQLSFELSTAATNTVVIPQGFQVGAQAADGSGNLVIFETDYSFTAVPFTIGDLFVQKGTVFSPIDSKAPSWLPFGKEARAGWSLCIGLQSTRTLEVNALSIGIEVAQAPGAPPPASAGGLTPLPVPPPPVLQWEIHDGSSFKPAELLRDDTSNLAHSGVMVLRIPVGWRSTSLPGVTADASYWLRLRLIYGQFASAPELTALRLNVVSAKATRSIRDEILLVDSDITGEQRQQQKLRLSQTPVLPGSIILEVDESGGLADPGTPAQRWEEVIDLNVYGPEDKVFILDPEAGVLTFGNGVQGMALPLGFRHVKAVVYQVGSGAAGAVDADKITQLLSSAAFVSKVTNPRRAAGGLNAEEHTSAIERGPEEIRAQSRAVAVADYELLALRAGASIARAHAVSAHHPQHPGSRIPGVVGLFIVPTNRGDGPPIAGPDTLAAVAKHLAKTAAPVGVEVVTTAVKFHRVRVELSAVIQPEYSTADVTSALIDSINRYIDYVHGGDDVKGWPFGGPLRYSSLLQRLVRTSGVTAVPRLSLIVDGRRLPTCADYLTPPNELLWAEAHEVIPVETI